ncbi:hypothetical protein CQ12_34665 [Bradyrhizobium jicamae]|uniref:Uncharacterized protein n=1 Tax=Bradyrhizobium jicamae TaxID=280332 RepID=A0A0R3LPC6_9BRAD|nr:hypothetical protein CQ12_34665 [Bradyrhizobium jicamae]
MEHARAGLIQAGCALVFDLMMQANRRAKRMFLKGPENVAMERGDLRQKQPAETDLIATQNR